MDFKKLGPYRIIKKLSNINYELKLLKEKGKPIHPIFHMLLLEKMDQQVLKSINKAPINKQTKYKVEEILTKNN